MHEVQLCCAFVQRRGDGDLDGLFRINTPAVVSEIIDGEAIIMHVNSGHYFSAPATGSLVWSWIEQGADTRSIVQRLAARFSAPQATLTEALGTFVSDLLSHDLIVPIEAPPVAPLVDDEVALPNRTAFVPPVLEVHTDMQDMLLLDPVDDVDETGWPAALPPSAAPLH